MTAQEVHQCLMMIRAIGHGRTEKFTTKQREKLREFHIRLKTTHETVDCEFSGEPIFECGCETCIEYDQTTYLTQKEKRVGL